MQLCEGHPVPCSSGEGSPKLSRLLQGLAALQGGGSFGLFGLQAPLNPPASSMGKRCWVVFFGVDVAGRTLAGLQGTSVSSKQLAQMFHGKEQISLTGVSGDLYNKNVL